MADQETIHHRKQLEHDQLQGGQRSSPSQHNESTDEGRIVLRSQATAGVWWSRWRSHLLFAGMAALLGPLSFLIGGEAPIDRTDYAGRTKRVLRGTPLVDGHNDLPWQLRIELHNRIYGQEVDLTQRLLGHTDLLRMQQGQVGGQFWSVYVDCDTAQKHLEDPSWVVRDALEQIDVTRRFIEQHPRHLAYCDNSACVRRSFYSGRIASMIGIEGSHLLGGSIAAIRQMYNLGARYITMTHNCDTSWGTSASTVAAGHPDQGLFSLGTRAVQEMNRLGMLVDLSHVSHQMMRDVMGIARAPVIFSHSGAYSIEPHLRHVPDDVLHSVKRNNGIVMVTFVNRFLNMKNPEQATVHDVVDHVIYIAELIGWEHVGIGSDFSGTPHVPIGLEDVSKYPDLLELVMKRGATDDLIRLLAGDNILRVWAEVEEKGRQIQATGELPVEDEYEAKQWHKGLKNSPWMLRQSREAAQTNGAADKPYMFNVDGEGKHNPLVKDP